MEKIKLNISTFVKANLPEVILISLIAILCLGLRLYKIDQYMTFLGDEGRDVRVIRNLLHGNLVFIGPQTSIGNMYLGPLYYYLVAPGLLISSFNPVGPAIEVALLGTLAVILTWFVGRTWFDKWTGLVAALLFSLSPVAIIYSRSSWNPNPMPLFSLLAIWGIWQVWKHKKYNYLIVVGVAMGVALQLHYLGLLLLPVLGIYWFFALKQAWPDQKAKKSVIRNTIAAIIIFLLMMSPLALFDLKHNFMNFKAFQAFFSDRQTTINLNPARSDRFQLILSQATGDLVLSRQTTYAFAVGIVIIILSVFFLIKSKQKPALGLLLLWLFIGLLGLIVYKQHVYDHYYGFLYPAIYLIVGLIISQLIQMNLIAKVISVGSLATLIYLSIAFSPLKDTPNNQLARTRQIVSLIIDQSGGKPFNFGLIAKQNYDESYRYFFEVDNAKMVRGEDKVTDQLFAVCEDGDSCKPEGNPAYQVAIFGPSHVIQQWNIGGVRVYKMLHSK